MSIEVETVWPPHVLRAKELYAEAFDAVVRTVHEKYFPPQPDASHMAMRMPVDMAKYQRELSLAIDMFEISFGKYLRRSIANAVPQYIITEKKP